MSSEPAWAEIGGRKHYFRSKWERNYARWLQFQKEYLMIEEWEYEPKTFWFEQIKRGVRSYKPDFHVIQKTSNHWIEVKGYKDSKSLTKIKRFQKYYPNEEIRIIDGEWFKKNNEKCRFIIKDWE